MMESKRSINVLALTAMALVSTSAVGGNSHTLEERVAKLEAGATQTESRWYDSVELSGLIEIEASYVDPDSGDYTSDLVVATVELGIEAQLAEQLSTSLLFLYEEDDTDLEVDVATLTYQLQNSAVALTLGQDYLPFGSYTTNLVNDPLTLEIGETRETALVATYENGAFSSVLYLFNGDQDEDGNDRVDNFGARILYTTEEVAFGVDYISNLADSDGLQENDYGYGGGEDAVAGFALHGTAPFGPIQLVLEHVAAFDELAVDGNNSEPSATLLEAGWESGSLTYAIAYQQTEEAQFLELPEERISLGLSTELESGLGLGFEVTLDDDYSPGEGGTGESTNSLVLQLAAQF